MPCRMWAFEADGGWQSWQATAAEAAAWREEHRMKQVVCGVTITVRYDAVAKRSSKLFTLVTAAAAAASMTR